MECLPRDRFMKRISLLLSCFLLIACTPKSVDRYHTGENEKEIISLLNQREYSKVIWLIENREKQPEGKTAFLLGQAYLGRSGIEPLAFAARITEAEPDSAEAREIFPTCPKGRISSAKEVEMKCLLKRVYLQAPKADGGDFARARLLLRKSYPNPSTAPEWVNTLVGLVDSISLVKRVGDLYLYGKGMRAGGGKISFNPRDIDWLKLQGKESLDDAREALSRANYSGEKVSRFLSANRANEWFERIEGTITFAKTVGLSRFLDFIRENLLKPTDEIRYGETLDRLKATIDLLDN